MNNPANAAPTDATAVFLHAAWRSRGTWIWNKLREQPGGMAFYEPLHEDLAVLDHETIGHLRPDSWGSGHGDGAPYFEEYGQLLGASGRGVRGYQRRFAFDHFFRGPGEPDHDLENYIRQLLDLAHAAGRRPLLKFCRSLGRVGWMRCRFPDALHAVVLRDPVAQWQSARRQWDIDGNHYFILAPFIVLARNAANPLLRDAMQRLDVTAPVRLGNNLAVAHIAARRHVQRLTWAQRYRGYLAVWAATAVAASTAGSEMIDADGLDDPGDRAAAEALFASIGQPVDLRPRAMLPPGSWPGTAHEARDAAAAALAALGLLNARLDTLPARQARLLTHMLTPRFAMPDGASASLPQPPRPGLARSVPPAALRRVDAIGYVALQLALYPLRRAHYYLWRWLGWHEGPGVRRLSGDGGPK